MPDQLHAKADDLQQDATAETPVIYEGVRRLGEQEMARPAMSLVWSGLAAGLSMGFSLVAQAALRLHLPDAPWRELVTALGYPIGFLMVVMSRQQLFTETTITVVVPLLARPSPRQCWRVLRMWGLVLATNLIGTGLFAWFAAATPAMSPELKMSMLAVSREAVLHPPFALAWQAVVAGYLMAAMVWLITSAGNAQVAIVTVITYLIGVGGFAHIIAGSVESVTLVLHGEMGWATMFGGFTLPVLVGNTIGGTGLFALLAHAQVMHEDDQGQPGGA